MALLGKITKGQEPFTVIPHDILQCTNSLISPYINKACVMQSLEVASLKPKVIQINNYNQYLVSRCEIISHQQSP